MRELTAVHVATLRILSAGIALIPFTYKAFQKIPRQKLGVVILSGLCGSFFPAYLFCIAETRIDSGLTAIFNSLTPLLTVIIGISFFQLKASPKKIIGVLIGFVGLCLLPLAGPNGIDWKDVSYALLVLLATVFYAFNVNLVGRHLKEAGSVNIAAVAFSFLVIPCLFILCFTQFFNSTFHRPAIWLSIGASAILGTIGTAVASILFYMLVKRSGAIFASLVTYGIPFIAVLWGVIYGEEITLLQLGCLGIILGGVYLVNK